MIQIFDIFNIDFSSVDSSSISLNDCRLDPSFYSSNQSFVSQLCTLPLSDLCTDIFNPLVFKREFVKDHNECRYLASAEIVSFEPDVTFITEEQALRLNLKVKKGTLLITGFGTIGNVRIVDDLIDGYAVANNVARLIPKENYLGFLACFLESTFGNKLLNDHAAGAVVKYIEAPQISKIPIPILPDEKTSVINNLYLKAVSCREKAFELLERAKTRIHQDNNLPTIDIVNPEDGVEMRIVSTNEFTNDFRLDANFYNPIAKKSVDNIIRYSRNYTQLGENRITRKIFYLNRFTRTFVSKDYGIPYLA